jgi:hypothetical protein
MPVIVVLEIRVVDPSGDVFQQAPSALVGGGGGRVARRRCARHDQLRGAGRLEAACAGNARLMTDRAAHAEELRARFTAKGRTDA